MAIVMTQGKPGSGMSLANEAVSVLYNRHHMNCIQCIAGGRGERYGQRCKVGLELWNLYQSACIGEPAAADRASFSSHEAAAAGSAGIVPPEGNTGGTLNRSAIHG